MLAVGSAAPSFALPNQHREVVRLSDFLGRRNLVIAFHPLAFTPVCSVQMQTYERERPRLDSHDTHVVAISLDAGPSKKAWADALGGISYDLLSDFHPHGEVTRAYGVMRDDGLPERAIFIVDRAGIVRWSRCYAIPEQPDIDALWAALSHLTSNR